VIEFSLGLKQPARNQTGMIEFERLQSIVFRVMAGMEIGADPIRLLGKAGW